MRGNDLLGNDPPAPDQTNTHAHDPLESG